MNLESLAKPVTSALTGRFVLVSLLPTTAAAALLLTLCWAGAPGPVRFARAWDTAGRLGGGEAFLLLLAVLLAGLVTMPLQLPLVRWLEGYWPRRLAWLSTWCIARQERRRGTIGAEIVTDPPSPEAARRLAQRMGERGDRQRARFPTGPGLLRPTALGNALTAAEARAGRRYGLDAVVVWTRLEPLLDDRVRATVADRRTTMDAAARLSVTAALCTPLSAWLLWRSGWWLLLAAALLAAARIAYTAAVHAAIDYGESVAAAFDLHRFDLLTALHLPLPADLDEERAANQALSDLWRQGDRRNHPFRYEHPDASPPASG
ncbi:hypothetical protein AF335_27080 [Streptomyces eurocidicus]|uniref:Uncharacterized protein n=1 Tax=Streptomyces eurocidicus TaxID=66423 RepID=A0A2N8NQE1_STREU|nr:hypothetical protein [Streptomyces eurocidicus]MBB5123095.1 hypothetical protein [Streptomyces eurocidicus]MBF6056227.1 hypothetical protein [Streptomyces eurocidicus]PNE30989.1 hypothetical protein AF335_27080 [Streptomyces eurocidicus]